MKLLCSLFAASTLMASAADISKIPFKTISEKETSLADYKGKDFVILGFPCNDFAGQEPGTAEEIQKFCKTKYDVSFPLMAKVHVKGKDQHPLYTALTGPNGAFPGDVSWNFGKFLIGKDGKPIARFEPKQTPESPELTSAIEKALK